MGDSLGCGLASSSLQHKDNCKVNRECGNGLLGKQPSKATQSKVGWLASHWLTSDTLSPHVPQGCV